MKHSLVLALVLTVTPLAAQESAPLRVGQTLSGTLTSDSEDAYTVALDAETFVFGNVNQVTVDAEVAVLGPDGEEVDSFDGPSRGRQNFTFETDAAGTYVIRVTPFEDEEGEYSITLEIVEPVASDIEGRVDQWMTPYSGDDTPGAVVGVMDGGEIVFEKAYGMANLSFGIPYEIDTPTNIGSVTKQFTGMSILLLQNDGLLSLSDEVRKHVPELPDFGTPVTIKNLLNHTGGFREIYNFLPMTGRGGEDHIRRDEAIQIVQRQPELQAEPNTEFNYNNTGFILLATIVERVSGKSFPEFMKERIFEPLGMNQTRVKYYQGEIIPGASTPYVNAEDGGGWRSARDLAASAGAGGIYTTWHDMRKWMLNYRDMSVGGPAAIELLTTPNLLANGDSTGYALGLGVGERRGQMRYAHTGGDVAHRTLFLYYPEIEAGIFMSSNNAGFAFPPADRLEDTFFPGRLDPVVDEEEEESDADVMSVERMEAIAGDWILTGPGLPAEFAVEDGSLFAEPQGQGRIELTTTSDSTAVVEELNVAITFHFEGAAVDSATFTQGQTTPMIRFDPDETSLDLAELVGRYYSKELELWLDVRVEDEELVVHRLQAEPVTLTHRLGLQFGGGFPFAEIVFQRADNGDITGLVTGNGRTKGVLFSRQ
jgi:CubicO group peptidase (beta-lactamase class C family)